MDNLLQKYRIRIDRVDRRLMRLLEKRFDLVRSVGVLKRREGVPVVQRERENEILHRIAERVRRSDARDFVRSVYRTLFKASYGIEEDH
jgi:chorismate mutase